MTSMDIFSSTLSSQGARRGSSIGVFFLASSSLGCHGNSKTTGICCIEKSDVVKATPYPGYVGATSELIRDARYNVVVNRVGRDTEATLH